MTKIVGVGTYGCVVKPSLECETNEKYNGRVSKIMAEHDAKEELKEMENIVGIPNIQKYILRLPKLCNPAKSKKFYDIIKKCNNRKVQTALSHNENSVKLLLLDDGGVDLEKFSNNIIKTLSDADINIFISSLLNLIKGVSFFLENNIIHHDIKLPNIVYNVKTADIKFIDFGIMMKYSDYIYSSKTNQNDMAQSWDYFPKEYSCVNKFHFDNLDKCKKYHFESYDHFLEKSAKTFDSYCLGFCLVDLFKNIGRRVQHIHPDFFAKSTIIAKEYCDPELHTRNKDLNSWYSRYKELLKKYNIYNVSNPTPSSRSIELADKYSIRKMTSASKNQPSPSKKSIVSLKPSRTKSKSRKTRTKKTKINIMDKPCPPGKIRNPNTKRCVKMKHTPKKKSRKPCPEGKVRSSKTGRCIKEKLSLQAKMRLPCPEGKERNPKTGNCIKTRKKKQ